MEKSLISVVMGVYNPPSYNVLKRAIDSVLNQTYENIELIICDDGSNVETKQWLDEIVQCDQRIKCLDNRTNVGLAATLNRCIQVSKGEYIARQDADDYSDKTRFDKQVDFLKKNPQYAFVGSNIYYFSEKGVWAHFLYPQYPQKSDFLWVSPFCHGSTLFRKKVLEAVGLYRVSKETLRCEDYDLFMRIYLEGYYAANLQERLYYFCEDEAAIQRRKMIDRIDEVKVRAKYFGKLGLYPKGIIYLVKPVVVGLVPRKLLIQMKNKFYKRKYKSDKLQWK